MSKRTPSDASPAVDPVFALAAAESSRRRDYEARCAQFQRELDRLAKPLNEAGTFIGDCSDEQFARDWAITLMSAGQAITEAGLCELVEDREEWMPSRLARTALRAANRGLAEVEAATHRILNDPMHREGVRTSLREIANEFARRLRERHDATLRDEFPTLAPNAVPVASPPTPPAGAEKSEGGKVNTAFSELLTAIDESGLSKAEAKVVRVIAEKNGSVPIVDANTLCDCDALSAFKRAKPKLRKRGWHLHEHHSSLCAKPLKQRGQN